MKGVAWFTVVFLLHSVVCVAGEIKGRIGALDVEAGTLEISGVKIIATKAIIKNSIGMAREISQLRVGDRVEVDGVFTGPGEMLATEIEGAIFQGDQLEGKLQRVDGERRTLLIGGIIITVARDARIRGEDGTVISINDLAVGEPLECRGRWSGSRSFSSSRVEVDRD